MSVRAGRSERASLQNEATKHHTETDVHNTHSDTCIRTCANMREHEHMNICTNMFTHHLHRSACTEDMLRRTSVHTDVCTEHSLRNIHTCKRHTHVHSFSGLKISQ